MSLNERISKIIEYSGYTSSEFADEIDVQRSSVSHITSGRNKPSLEFIIKIKSRFPEILWDWLVNGDGEMLKSDLPDKNNEEITESEKPKPTSLPDLFTLINEETNLEDNKDEPLPNFESVSESDIIHKAPEERKISDSQRLANNISDNIPEAIENQSSKIKRIVLFYENGKFESFEP
ncbi:MULTISPECIES: helix-turn-helix domain-containing protein [Chryseobacterium]|uniref:Helix-turn-helix domain n=1 Tax=Chryseobacterium taihuense TaxID=1141221 RepID=A0A4U8WKS3_9FLAO|nr:MULTISPECIES: helix-turn-helix transcriptional regulator [Chryseobacterium]QQV03846.1 helix-turn-helix transcriptional regulator [Chryseobacterium sp. FDAARGOS 1104]VFB02809.1 Helix-turn-helix domain [Chryseobacterium taihuense]